MIEYRKIAEADVPSVIAYCAEKEISVPVKSEVIFVAFEDDKIVGVVAVKKVFQIEPLIADTGLIAQVLGEKALAVISMADKPNVLVLSKNEGFIGQMERYGFEVTDKGITVLKREP